MRTHTVFPDEFPEAWASDWGEDEYGIFIGFTYKGVRQDFRWIEPGTFLMGSPADEPARDNDETQHAVTLSKGYWLADTCVTQALWKAVMGANPSRFQGANHPVENVSWDDAQAFITRMNEMKAALRLCLPTEAQWEYACRAGTSTPFSFGEGISPEIVNYDGNYPYHNGRKGEYREQTIEVGSLPPNAWGLYEMHGNVWEWCQDWYSNYKEEAQDDPQGPGEGTRRVLRGGSWILYGRDCRSACRYHRDPSNHRDSSGFRLARGL
jgi:formylglycine-generating enzyme required for sulfatase activity